MRNRVDELFDQAIAAYNAFAPALLSRSIAEERRRDANARLLLLRDSITYRSDAAAWHASLITRLQKGAIAQMHARFGQDPNSAADILFVSAREQQYAFDDVVFNAISLFDYVGNAVAFALYGEPHHKAKWSQIEKYSRNAVLERKETRGDRISAGALGSTIKQVHSSLVLRLTEYRSELLHYQSLPAGGQSSTDIGANDVTHNLEITAPEAFSKWCRIPGFDETDEVPIQVAGAWVCEQSQLGATAVLRELERELRREAGRDPDGSDRVIQML